MPNSSNAVYAGQDYAFRERNTVFDSILVIALSGIVIFALIKLFFVPLALLMILPVFLYLLFLQYNALRITMQYNRYDEGKYVSINNDTSELTLTQNGNAATITSADVKQVEVYSTKNLGKFGRFDHVAIITNTGSKLIITNFTIPRTINEQSLEKFLKGKKRVYFARTFNYIK